MDEKIFVVARKIFGERRFEELMGQLWLDRERLVERAAGRVSALPAVLREWENRFRRDVEEGRWRHDAHSPRQRVMRFAEITLLHERDRMDMSPEDTLMDHVKETF